jgi:hypothetical protein
MELTPPFEVFVEFLLTGFLPEHIPDPFDMHLGLPGAFG